MPTNAEEMPDSLTRYFSEVDLLDQPSRDQEREWFRRFDKLKAHSPAKAKLKGEIAEGYVRFVIRQARGRTQNRTLLGDLISAGNVGLMIAIDKFEVERGWRFLSYAGYWIDVYMQMLLNTRLVHVPTQVLKDQRARKKEEDDEMARGERVSYSFIEVSMSDITKVQEVCAAEEPEVEKTETDVLGLLERAALPRRHRLVLIWSFGLREGAERSLEEIANILMLLEHGAFTREDIRKIRDEAVGLVKDYLEDHELEGSWEL